MVRLEIILRTEINENNLIFTFQYGQIRNSREINKYYRCINIYIPVWLDQKLQREEMEELML